MQVACFDLTGTLIHHEDHHTIPLMPELLRSLHQKGWQLRVTTTWGKSMAESLLIPVYRAAQFPAGSLGIVPGVDKAGYIAQVLAGEAESVIFVDDKPKHIQAVQGMGDARVRVFGFLGSRKYVPEARWMPT